MQSASDKVEGQAIRIRYRNYRGEEGVRRIRPTHIWFGSTTWHPQPQWLMDAIDLDKGAERSFALADILDFDCADMNVPNRR